MFFSSNSYTSTAMRAKTETKTRMYFCPTSKTCEYKRPWTALPVSLRVREGWWNYLETDFLLLFKCDYKATPRFKLVFWLQDPPKSIANWIIFSVVCVVCCFVFNELWVFGQGLRFLLLDRYGVSSMVGMPNQHATQKTDMHSGKFISPCTQYQQKPLQGK